MRFLPLLLIRLYQLCLSPLLPGTCRFTPGCSHYAREAFHTHGFLEAGMLTFKRLARCHPWGGRGFDPVPAAKKDCT